MVGECTGKMAQKVKALGWGRMYIRTRPQPYEAEPWGFDNGAFTWHLAGQPFNATTYLKRLDRAILAGTPRVAVCPDIVSGGERSLEFSLAWWYRLPRDWPWYLVVQDGMDERMVRPHLYGFAGIFLGGGNKFKATARQWADLAHAEGLRFHYGRAGTLHKLEHAYEVGADSVDSAFPMWTKRRFWEFERHWRHRPQLTIHEAMA